MSFTGVYPDGAQGALFAFLYADPAAHSLSPAMHRAAFAFAGLRGDYQAVRVPPADLGAAIVELRQQSILGANLSLPHKETALSYLDSLTPAARAVGAVNTIISREGKLLGDNTDAPGFLAALNDADVSADGGAVVLGAGGAARAAVWALRSQGRQVVVVNRTRAKAERLTAELGGRPADLHEVNWADVGLIVNASSAGLNAPEASPLPDFEFSQLPKAALMYDMVYKPAETRLMREARAAGLRAENGLGMLAHQARLAFLAWTGVDVPVQVFLDALHAAQPPALQGTARHV
ncbi:shikimate dehydrogenase [Deinococcus oregonensis]|uniref:Shikimate dehydrogenase (NADP(+)) n=1 Tax=Deinococcus oregonensis TaxID=1805970 RepID=A0ABV6AY82_9DEIO